MAGTETTTVLTSTSFNPRLNMAIEDHLFQKLQPENRLLFIYRNSDAVVIGKFQNPWIECPVELLSREGVPLLRRQSGGGAVFHDTGNINISFMAARGLYSQDENYTLLLNTLHSFGIPAEKNDRNDLVLAGKKISGSAFKKTSAKSLHHCTLLLQADLAKIRKYLHPELLDISAKGTKSVRSPVANCRRAGSAVGYEEISSGLIDQYRGAYGITDEIGAMDEEHAMEDEAIRRRYDELQSWEWVFGKTPPFTQPLEWRSGVYAVSAELSIRHCMIEELKILQAEPAGSAASLSALAEALAGVPYRRKEIDKLLRSLHTGPHEYHSFVSDFLVWLGSAIYFS